MFRYKTRIGPTRRARKFAAQQSEANLACSVINRMTPLGMPISQRIRSESKQESCLAPNLDLCTNAGYGEIGEKRAWRKLHECVPRLVRVKIDELRFPIPYGTSLEAA